MYIMFFTNRSHRSISLRCYSALCRRTPNLAFINNKFKCVSLSNREYVSSSAYYKGVVKEAEKYIPHLKYADVVNIISQFVVKGYDNNILKRFFADDPNPRHDLLGIYDFFVILHICKKISIEDLDLISSLSENVRIALWEKFSSKVDGGGDNEDKTPGYSRNKNALNEFKDIIFATCHIYNDLGILYDPLFVTISNIALRYIDELCYSDWDLLLRAYSKQKYKDAQIVSKLVSKIADEELKGLSPTVAASIFCSLCYMDLMLPGLREKLENFFMTKSTGGDLNESLDLNSLIEIAYANMLLCPVNENLYTIISSLNRIAFILENVGNPSRLTANQQRKLCATVSYIKCLKEDYYFMLKDSAKSALASIIAADSTYKKFKSTKFVGNVSEYLKKLRIRHETNVYVNGIWLDIVEKDRNLAWMCNSYHRFYAKTFDMTAEYRFLTNLIAAFGYKVSQINYYQWGRLKAKRTRFAFLRMARYYALNDNREYDPQYAGWSLPYVWWNASARDQLHISNYINHRP